MAVDILRQNQKYGSIALSAPAHNPGLNEVSLKYILSDASYAPSSGYKHSKVTSIFDCQHKHRSHPAHVWAAHVWAARLRRRPA